MKKDIELIENILTEKSIEWNPIALLAKLEIRYNDLLDKHKFPKGDLSTMRPSEVTHFLKRNAEPQIGKYENITVFEAANRIASDLVLLTGLQVLVKETGATEFRILFGNHHVAHQGDFSLKINGEIFEGEAFSTAPSFFNQKLSSTRSKWKPKDTDKADVLEAKSRFRYILFNSDTLVKQRLKFPKEWAELISRNGITVWHRR